MSDTPATPAGIPSEGDGNNKPAASTPAPITTTAPSAPKSFTLPPIPEVRRPVPANPPVAGHAVTAKPSNATAPPNKPQTEAVSGLALAKSQTIERIKEILHEHDHMESNIGHGHEYWSLKDQLRTIEEKLGDALFK